MRDELCRVLKGGAAGTIPGSSHADAKTRGFELNPKP